MKKTSSIFLAALSASVAAPSALAVNGHYSLGIEGLGAAAAPPQGLYYRGYLVHYEVDSFNDGSGSSVPGNNSGTVSALAHRFIWMTDKTVLGADYGMETIIPMLDIEFDLDVAGGSRFDDDGIGDLFVGPIILGWHGSQWDITLSLIHISEPTRPY